MMLIDVSNTIQPSKINILAIRDTWHVTYRNVELNLSLKPLR